MPPITLDSWNYPYDSRPNINFDHRAHFDVHFLDQRGLTFEERDLSRAGSQAALTVKMYGAESACQSCHRTDGNGHMIVLPYESMCADCHDRQLLVDAPSFEVTSIPRWLSEFDADGEDFDEELLLLSDGETLDMTPMLVNLLGGRESAREAIRQLVSIPKVSGR